MKLLNLINKNPNNGADASALSSLKITVKRNTEEANGTKDIKSAMGNHLGVLLKKKTEFIKEIER